jgi:hypothetical protein
MTIIAAYLLVLVLIHPGGRIEASTRQAPTEDRCKAAGNAWIADGDDGTRRAICHLHIGHGSSARPRVLAGAAGGLAGHARGHGDHSNRLGVIYVRHRGSNASAGGCG